MASFLDHSLPWGGAGAQAAKDPTLGPREAAVWRVATFCPSRRRRLSLKGQKRGRQKTLLALASDAWCQGGVNPLRAPRALDRGVCSGRCYANATLAVLQGRGQDLVKHTKKIQKSNDKINIRCNVCTTSLMAQRRAYDMHDLRFLADRCLLGS